MVASVQVSQAGVCVTKVGRLGIAVSYVGETLCNGEDLVMYVFSPDRVTTVAGLSIPNVVHQDSEEGCLVFHVREKQVRSG